MPFVYRFHYVSGTASANPVSAGSSQVSFAVPASDHDIKDGFCEVNESDYLLTHSDDMDLAYSSGDGESDECVMYYPIFETVYTEFYACMNALLSFFVFQLMPEGTQIEEVSTHKFVRPSYHIVVNDAEWHAKSMCANSPREQFCNEKITVTLDMEGKRKPIRTSREGGGREKEV